MDPAAHCAAYIPTVSNDQYTDPKIIFVEMPNWCKDQYSDPYACFLGYL
jgi:hypothetical protein